MKQLIPKPLFLALLLMVISVIGVGTMLASNSGSETVKKEVIKPVAAKPQLQVSEPIPLKNEVVSTNDQTPSPEPQPAAEQVENKQANAQPKPQPKPVTQSKPKPVTQSKPKPEPVATVAGTTTQACSGSLSVKFMCLLNEYRVSKNLGKLSYSNSLEGVAYKHSTWMSTTGTLAHVNADGIRHNIRCELSGTTCRAENLAQGIWEAEELLSEWKQSGSHNVNLLGPYSTMGLGMSGEYITLLFN